MNFDLDASKADGYKNPSQIVRITTENWVAGFAFCPNCGADTLVRYKNNKPVADYYCAVCNEEYELKSKKDTIPQSILGGAYSKMIERITSSNNPNFFILSYSSITQTIKDLLVVPKHFFTPSIVVRRTPLSEKARRAGWTGCKILIGQIPDSGKIFIVRDGVLQSKSQVLEAWKRTIFLRTERDVVEKGWLLDVMRCLQVFGKNEFSLSDAYLFELVLQRLHPENKHVKDKIRQQLQILRDKKYLQFLSRGNYRLLE